MILAEGHLGLQLFLIFILIMINAFFAAAEIAVITVNDNKVRHDAEDGNKKAQKLLKLVEHPGEFLSTIQIAITLAGFLASAFAADSFSDRLVLWLSEDKGFTAISPTALNTISVILITCVLSYFTLVLGELVPKRIAMQKADKLAAAFASIILVAGKLFRPFVWLLAKSTNGMLRLFGIDPHSEPEEVSEEEIRMMVNLGEEKGSIEATEKMFIENIFEFNNITAEDVMIHRTDMKVVWLDDSDTDIMNLIRESGLSRFPVCGDDIDDVIGLLRTREYLLNAQSSQPQPLRELIAPIYFVPESVPADKLFLDMQQKKTHIAVVVDEYGGTSGLVTLEDLLEEIVGNIYDEFDPLDTQEIIQLAPNLWRMRGSVEIETLEKELEINIPQDEEEYDFSTMGGLVFSQLSEIPPDGSQPELDAFGLHIKVEQFSERRVEWVLVSKLLPDVATDEDSGKND
jgi:putative hemolysin